MTDWKQVAETLRDGWYAEGPEAIAYENAEAQAIALCLLVAKLPPGEAERVLEEAVAQEAEPECAHVNTERKNVGGGWFDVCCECGEQVDA